MAVPQHSGSVYKHRGKNDWKESWLCLETDGKLTWKKKDAYEVKGIAYVKDLLDQIEISGWSAKKCEQNKAATPFLMRLPIEVRGTKTTKTMIVKSGADLDLWLDAFATVVGKWKLWKVCKQRQAFKIGKQKSMDERSVETQLKYEELVEFYKTTWATFLASYKAKGPENEEQNGASQNTTTYEDAPAANGDRYAPNPSSNPGQGAPPNYNAVRNQTQHQSQQVHQVTTSVTVHRQMNGDGASNGQNAQKKGNEVYGEEDDGDELHF